MIAFMIISNGLNVSKRKLKGLLQNTQKSAEVINLVYVSDKDPGIERSRRGENFIYSKNGKRITNKNDLLRIRKLVLPPAWENVWICSFSNGHLQATGYDVKKRNNINIILYGRSSGTKQNFTNYWNLERNYLPYVRSLPGIFQNQVCHWRKY